MQKLEEYFINMGGKKYNASQVFEWIYKKKVKDINDFSNIKSEIRDRLKNDFELYNVKIIKKEEDKLVNKYLFELKDGEKVEAVLMRHDYGLSVCISSQVGCNMGCKFCESGRLKKVRDLLSSEMVQQILLIEEDVLDKIDRIVIMGIGEPFDNYDNVMNFLQIVNDPKGLMIGARHLTVSTSGLVPSIDKFKDFPLQVNLAISLHSADDNIRNKIMPINKVYNISMLIDSIKRYTDKTNRRVTIEYILLDNINDSYEDAVKLSKLLKGLNVYVNLIPYNETNNSEFKRSKRVKEFQDELLKLNINTTVRKEFGSNISAACGQLRSKEVKK